MPSNVVGAQVRKIRDAHVWSQEMLAARCNRYGWDVSRGTVAKLEAKIRCVNDEELRILARALKVSVDDLYPESGRGR